MKHDKKIKANVPNLRFPEFEGEWEEWNLSHIGNTYSGLSGKSAEDFGAGSKYIQYKQVFDSSRIDLNKCGLVKIGPSESQNKVQYGDVIFTTSSETPSEVGYSSVLLEHEENVYLNSFCFGYRLDTNVLSPEFAQYIFRSPTVRRNITVLAQGSTRYNISKNELQKQTITIPVLEEQTKIATFLSLLDQRIETQNKIIEELKKLKNTLRDILYKRVEKFGVPIQIKDLLAYEQPGKYIVDNDEYIKDSTQTPVLTANKAFILGYTAETEGVYDKGNCIVFDDFTMDLKYVDFPFKVKSSAIKILTSRSGVCLQFMSEYLSFLKLTTNEHKRHYISEVEQMYISVPDTNTQETIANIFAILGEKINLECRVLALRSKQKKYLLQQMFI